MANLPGTYFHLPIHLSGHARTILQLDQILHQTQVRHYPPIVLYRRLAARLHTDSQAVSAVSAAELQLYGTLLEVFRHVVTRLAEVGRAGQLAAVLEREDLDVHQAPLMGAMDGFVALFPPASFLDKHDGPAQAQLILQEMLLVRLAAENSAVDPFRVLFDDTDMIQTTSYQQVMDRLTAVLADGPPVPGFGAPLMEVLRAPLVAAPDSLAGQLGYIREHWGELLPRELFEEVLTAFDILEEEQAARGIAGPGPSMVLTFDGGGDGRSGSRGKVFEPGHVAGYDQPEYEAFSPDADWMSNVVLMAKMTHVWLDQLARRYGYPITRLDQVPDDELDQLAARGFTALWLIGLWERSPASQRIKELCGNPEAHASAYSLFDYTIAADLGGEAAFHNLKQRAWQRGIRMASDMVPNHTGIYSRWVIEHPDWFIQTDYPPFPSYRFNGEDLSHDPSVTIQIEDGYWSKDDAAVAFRMIDRRDGRTRYLYHGNDGTSTPWNDTAQLNYLIPEVRDAVMQTILHVARLTPIIRFDAAMTLAKKHYQRLWFPQRGLGGGIPSRAEHAMSRDEFDAVFPQEFWREVVDRVAREVPDTLLLAEAFWLMEGYFVRTLGMHRVYNSAFMNMLKAEENAKYRQSVKNVLAFNPEILKRFVNFMNNPDEKTAVEQFGSQGKYFGACLLLATMPGLPMFGHGQIEGFREKYGMEYRRAYWDEAVDQGLLEGHRLWIFPVLQRRWLFSGSECFRLYDFRCHDGSIDENVFAYSNRAGGERGVVIYNNRHGRTSGWLQDAAAVAVRSEVGDQVLQQHTTLAAALGVENGPDRFVAFRDLISGLEYLRSSRELHEQGLYAELGEYEFHLFWEFRELHDQPEIGWGALCRELAGRGVASLDDERVQLQHRGLLTACAELLALFAAAPVDEAELMAAVQRYVVELPSVMHGALDMPLLSGLLRDMHDPVVARNTLRLLRAGGVDRRKLPFGRLQRRAVLVLLATECLVVPLGSDALETYGLLYPLASFIAGSEQWDRDWGQYQAVRCSVVAAAWLAWRDPFAHDNGERLTLMLALPDVERFLLVHDDNGTTWFNKERFEELLCWLALRACFEQARGQTADAVPIHQFCELAAGSGYRLKRLIRLAGTLGATA